VSGVNLIWIPKERPLTEACVRERMVEFAEDLLLTFWPELRGKSVAIEELVSKGLPPGST
jgi:hypothetical protein